MPTNNKRRARTKTTESVAPSPDGPKRYTLAPHDYGELAQAMIESHAARANVLAARGRLPAIPVEHLSREADRIVHLSRQSSEADTKFNTLFASICEQMSIDPVKSSVQLVSDRLGFALLVKAIPAPAGTDVPPTI